MHVQRGKKEKEKKRQKEVLSLAALGRAGTEAYHTRAGVDGEGCYRELRGGCCSWLVGCLGRSSFLAQIPASERAWMFLYTYYNGNVDYHSSKYPGPKSGPLDWAMPPPLRGRRKQTTQRRTDSETVFQLLTSARCPSTCSGRGMYVVPGDKSGTAADSAAKDPFARCVLSPLKPQPFPFFLFLPAEKKKKREKSAALQLTQ